MSNLQNHQICFLLFSLFPQGVILNQNGWWLSGMTDLTIKPIMGEMLRFFEA